MLATIIRILATLLLLLSADNSFAVSLHEKIGQLFIIGFDGNKVNTSSEIAKAISKDNLGGVILFDYNYKTKKFDKNIANPNQVKRLNNHLQQLAAQANYMHHRPNLPLLISVDYEGGKVNRLKSDYGFPPTYSQADIANTTSIIAHKAAHQMASTLKESGFNLNFSPLTDVNVNPGNPVIGKLDRSFSSNPMYVYHFANIYAQEYRNQGIQCAYKHFPGHGSSTADSHLGFVDVSQTWQAYEILPYSLLIPRHQTCSMIMSAHIVNRQLDDSGLPATLSHKMLTGILRNKLNFTGVIITDDMQMKAISDNYSTKQAMTMALNAGADMFIFGNQLSDKRQKLSDLISIIEQQVKAGKISKKRINQAYQHVVQFKQSLT